MDDQKLLKHFSELPTEDLIQKYTSEKNSYTEEAFNLIKRELWRRGFDERRIKEYTIKKESITLARNFICPECGEIGGILDIQLICRSCGFSEIFEESSTGVSSSNKSGDGEAEVNAETAEEYFHLGTEFSENSKIEQAVDAYEKAIRLDPFLTDAYYNLAVIFIEKKYYDMAWDCATALLKLNDPEAKELVEELERLSVSEEVSYENPAPDTEEIEPQRISLSAVTCGHCRKNFAIPVSLQGYEIQCPFCFAAVSSEKE